MNQLLRTAACLLAGALWLAPLQARVTRIVIDEVRPMPAAPAAGEAAPANEMIAGRAFGELDPAHPLHALIRAAETSAVLRTP